MTLVLNTPLADALASRIQPKLVEIGWSLGGEDSSPLSEYICLMLVNGKSQEQIAAELSGDLLGLSPGDNSATEFASWLFQQMDSLKSADGPQQQQQQQQHEEQQSQVGQAQNQEERECRPGNDVNGPMDQEMKDFADGDLVDGVPTAPKAMRQPRDKWIMNQLHKAMERPQGDVLHRVRNQGPERINTHKRDPSKGSMRPQYQQQRGPNNRPQQPRMNGRNGFGPPPSTFAQMNPQQQMAFYQMYQQQSQIMQPYIPPHGGPHNRHHGGPLNGLHGGPPPMGQMNGMNGMGGGMSGMTGMNGMADDPYANNLSQPRRANGSLFERIQAPQMEFQHGRNDEGGMDTSEDNGVSSSENSKQDGPLDEIPCKFGSSCTRAECSYGHPTPAALPGTRTTYISGEKCPFGAGCKNRKCTGSHPSPAAGKVKPVKIEQDCKFYPNCTNPQCPYKHPPMPLCRNGSSCTRPDCHFTHTEVKCKFNPCLNPACIYKHDEGQQQGTFDNKVWTAPKKEHVSERKFVDEEGGEEELIIPGQGVVEVEKDMDTAPVEDIE
ncbi:hypothetical protein RUND412_006682 [Rhizina undulata]